MQFSPFIECLCRLYAQGKVNEAKLNELVQTKKITPEELAVVLAGRKEDAD